MTEQGGLRPFAHLGAEKAEAYRAVLGVFAAARARFTVHLRPEDVAEQLPASRDGAELAAVLDQLVAWGNLRADPDTGRVTTVEDFHRARFLYSLTREGEAVETAVAAYDEALGRRGELQAVALADIRDQLRALAALDPADDAKAHAGLILLTERFRGLAANAGAFMASVQRTVDLADADVEVFLAYKDRLVDYLQRFVRDLVVASADIAAHLDELAPRVPALLEAAAAREARDAAPGDDDAGGDDRRREHLLEWQARWTGLRRWFIGDRVRPSQSALLRDRARSAVPALLSAAATLHERRSGRSDRSADFRRLALWFAEAPDDDTCHRLWRAAFGLVPARHLTVDADTLDARQDRPVGAATSWADAPPLLVHPRLRRTGRAERRGPPAAVTDRSAARAHLAALAEEERSQAEAARRRLATGRPSRLSEIGDLDTAEFGLFLALLGDALSARSPGTPVVETTTSDGSLLVRLAATHDGRRAAVRTPGGVLSGPDHVLTVTALDEVEDEREQEAAS
jgi:uncharacterized protein (TIGR02677 family)